MVWSAKNLCQVVPYVVIAMALLLFLSRQRKRYEQWSPRELMQENFTGAVNPMDGMKDFYRDPVFVPGSLWHRFEQPDPYQGARFDDQFDAKSVAQGSFLRDEPYWADVLSSKPRIPPTEERRPFLVAVPSPYDGGLGSYLLPVRSNDGRNVEKAYAPDERV